MSDNTKALAPIESLKRTLSMQTVQEQFKNCLQDSAPLFVASLVDLFGTDKGLQKCSPALVIREALKAAVLRLPIAKSLGFAWIIPYYSTKDKAFIPQFQIGWKGIVQLAQRTAQYKFINCGPVLEGQFRGMSRLTGYLDIEGEAISDKVVGHFAYIETINGFSKSSYWIREKVEAHAIRYNQECKKAGKLAGNWAEYFDERATATVLKHLISKYGPMTVEMAQIVAKEDDTEARAEAEIEANANSEVVEAEWEKSAMPEGPPIQPEAAGVQREF